MRSIIVQQEFTVDTIVSEKWSEFGCIELYGNTLFRGNPYIAHLAFIVATVVLGGETQVKNGFWHGGDPVEGVTVLQICRALYDSGSRTSQAMCRR